MSKNVKVSVINVSLSAVKIYLTIPGIKVLTPGIFFPDLHIFVVERALLRTTRAHGFVSHQTEDAFKLFPWA